MTRLRHDLGKLRRTLIIALLMTLGGCALLRMAMQYRQRAEQQQAQARRQGDELEGRFRRLGEDERELRRQAALFAELRQRGIVDGEERLSWIEALHAWHERHPATEMSYEFAPRQAVGAAGHHTFYRSPMSLQLTLAHEGELIDLLDVLRRDAPALVAMRHCQMQRLEHAPAEENEANATAETHGGGRLNLAATCALEWINAQENRP